jgi:hypothetical protein
LLENNKTQGDNMSQEKKSFKYKYINPLPKTKSRVFISLFSLGILALALTFAFSQEHEPIKHEVSVNRMVIPVFAFDSSGKPVFDLQKEELGLYINGYPVEINSLNRIQFESDSETTKKVKEGAGKTGEEEPLTRKRVVFLVLDTMFNSFYGLKNARKIANKLVENDTAASEFVIMQNSLFGGLKLIGGPETDKKKIKKYIKKVMSIPEDNPIESDYDITVRSPLVPWQQKKMIRREERKFEKEKIKIFVDFISRLKYSLEAIDQPRIVFLISEGFPQILFYEANLDVQGHISYDPTPFFMLKQLVKEINDGGSLFYTIYPGRVNLQIRPPHDPGAAKGEQGELPDLGYTLDDVYIPIVRDSGIESLKTLGVGSGGQFFDGTNERIIKEIHKTTTAYYELAFNPRPEFGPDMHIKIKCKRKGVRIDSLVRTVKSKAYADMLDIQKKVFALNVVMERNWANREEKIKKGDFKWRDNEQTALEVKIPENMKNHPVDIFIIQFDGDFKNPDIKMTRQMVTDTAAIDFKKKENKQTAYFLIVEPVSTLCIYNEISLTRVN